MKALIKLAIIVALLISLLIALFIFLFFRGNNATSEPTDKYTTKSDTISLTVPLKQSNFYAKENERRTEYLKHINATARTITLSKRGIEVDIPLQDTALSINQTSNHHIIARKENVQAILSLERATVFGKAKREKDFFASFQKDFENYIVNFEELPDIVTESTTFKVRKFTYYEKVENPKNAEKLTTITAFCKVNYRYIYVIKLGSTGHITERSKVNITADMLADFTSHIVTKRPYQYQVPIEMLVMAIAFVFGGILVILNEIRIKRFRRIAIGTIIGYETSGRRSIGIIIKYQLPNGKEVQGKAIVSFLEGIFWSGFYKDKTGSTVKISYSEKNPRFVNILSIKSGYFFGIFCILSGLCFIFL